VGPNQAGQFRVLCLIAYPMHSSAQLSFVHWALADEANTGSNDNASDTATAILISLFMSNPFACAVRRG
jgi:hypothetical protein